MMKVSMMDVSTKILITGLNYKLVIRNNGDIYDGKCFDFES